MMTMMVIMVLAIMMWMMMVMMNIMTVMIGMIVKDEISNNNNGNKCAGQTLLYTSKEAKQNRVVGGVYIIMRGPHGDRWSIYIT